MLSHEVVSTQTQQSVVALSVYFVFRSPLLLSKSTLCVKANLKILSSTLKGDWMQDLDMLRVPHQCSANRLCKSDFEELLSTLSNRMLAYSLLRGAEHLSIQSVILASAIYLMCSIVSFHWIFWRRSREHAESYCWRKLREGINLFLDCWIGTRGFITWPTFVNVNIDMAEASASSLIGLGQVCSVDGGLRLLGIKKSEEWVDISDEARQLWSHLDWGSESSFWVLEGNRNGDLSTMRVLEKPEWPMLPLRQRNLVSPR